MLKLALWPRKSIGHNVSSKDEMNLIMEQAKKPGQSWSNPPTRSFGKAMPAIFRTRTAMCGKLHGIRSGKLENRGQQFGG